MMAWKSSWGSVRTTPTHEDPEGAGRPGGGLMRETSSFFDPGLDLQAVFL